MMTYGRQNYSGSFMYLHYNNTVVSNVSMTVDGTIIRECPNLCNGTLHANVVKPSYYSGHLKNKGHLHNLHILSIYSKWCFITCMYVEIISTLLGGSKVSTSTGFTVHTKIPMWVALLTIWCYNRKPPKSICSKRSRVAVKAKVITNYLNNRWLGWKIPFLNIPVEQIIFEQSTMTCNSLQLILTHVSSISFNLIKFSVALKLAFNIRRVPKRNMAVGGTSVTFRSVGAHNDGMITIVQSLHFLHCQ